MKYRNTKTGRLYRDLEAAVDAFCCGKFCEPDCPLHGSHVKLFHGNDGCGETARREYPDVVAKSIGVEPVEEGVATGASGRTDAPSEDKAVDNCRHGMSNERFTELVEELRSKSLDTLLEKNANYASDDRLHNFRLGAAIIGGTPAQAALGYMAKHMASLIDKVRRDDFSDREDLLEKCQDIINYVVFIWCCGNEEMEKYTQGGGNSTRNQDV